MNRTRVRIVLLAVLLVGAWVVDACNASKVEQMREEIRMLEEELDRIQSFPLPPWWA